MKNQVFINHLDYYIPEDRIYFKDHLDHFEQGKEAPLFDTADKFFAFLKKFIDIESVTVEKNNTQEENTMNLLKKNIEAGKINPKRVALLLVAPDVSEQIYNFGHRVQHELGMTKAKVIRISDNFCTNIDLSFGIAKMFLENMAAPADALIIGGNQQGNTLEGRVVGSYGVMGDGVCLALLTNEAGNNMAEMLGQESVTKGVLHTPDLSKDNTILHFQGITECLKAALASTKVAAADIGGVVLHNANVLLISESIKSCGIKPHLIDRTNQLKYGHLGTTDLVLNLKTYIDNNAGKPGVVLTTNQGVNGTYVSTLYKI